MKTHFKTNIINSKHFFQRIWQGVGFVVKDGGYMIPVGTWVGVPMGMGMGPLDDDRRSKR